MQPLISIIVAVEDSHIQDLFVSIWLNGWTKEGINCKSCHIYN